MTGRSSKSVKKPAAKKKAAKKKPAAKKKAAKKKAAKKKAAKKKAAAKTKPAAKKKAAKKKPAAKKKAAAKKQPAATKQAAKKRAPRRRRPPKPPLLVQPPRTVTPADVLAAARESAASGDPGPYVRARDVLVAETEPTLRSTMLSHMESMRQLADRLQRTPNPEVPIGPLEAATVAVLVEPDSIAARKTRGLAAMAALRPDLAREDFERALALGDAKAQLLLDYLRVTFAPPGFCPIALPLGVPPLGPGQAGCVRDAAALREQLQVYATRVHVLRERLLDLGVSAHAPWLVPDVSSLLPQGPVPLQRWPYAPEPGVALEVDQTVHEPNDPVTALERMRCDWAALTLLLHLTGHSTLTLPGEITPRAELVHAMEWVEFGLWRAKTQEASGGAQATAQGLPDLMWRDGFSVGALSKDLARIAAQEFAELYAAVTWLTAADCSSPFEQGLRF